MSEQLKLTFAKRTAVACRTCLIRCTPVSGRSGCTHSSDAAASTGDEDGLVEETRGVEDGHGGKRIRAEKTNEFKYEG